MLSADICAPIATAGDPDVTGARCDVCVIALEAMSVGLIAVPNRIFFKRGYGDHW